MVHRMSRHTHIRVSTAVRDALDDLAEQLLEQADLGRQTAIVPDREPINPSCRGISRDSVIQRLLEVYYAQKRRMARSAENRRKRKGGAS